MLLGALGRERHWAPSHLSQLKPSSFSLSLSSPVAAFFADDVAGTRGIGIGPHFGTHSLPPYNVTVCACVLVFRQCLLCSAPQFAAAYQHYHHQHQHHHRLCKVPCSPYRIQQNRCLLGWSALWLSCCCCWFCCCRFLCQCCWCHWHTLTLSGIECELFELLPPLLLRHSITIREHAPALCANDKSSCCCCCCRFPRSSTLHR